MKLLSAIVPCFNEQENIFDFYDEFMKNEAFFKSHDVDFELIFVDDGSKDETVSRVKELNEKDKRVHLVSFSRNFGKESAMYAGLNASKGDYVVIMDCDLQDPPALLPEMLKAITEEGYDSVATRRVNRKGEPPIRSFFARQFYKIINKMTKAEIVDGARDYRLMTRDFVNAILSMGEYNRFSKGIFGWVGFKNKWLEFENIERKKGETKWSFWKLFAYALDGIMAFSTAPLAMASFLGVFFCIVAFLFIIIVMVRQWTVGDPNNTVGWASMVCIILFVSGVQLFCVGIVGQYLSKTYLEVKNRPLYIVKEEL
ncbi:glycosyltransferase family 2 protein [Butyrivibrio sp. FCS006]|uniref:glycosyltransferase family 2 protein n=1 Tax=Butyrivibrio sp. FCS006 TaxID=1280684 RepID=UPI000409EE00|nr:glycosyltransferase family 2 protein [Butyrivibrio sp. FCS006]